MTDSSINLIQNNPLYSSNPLEQNNSTDASAKLEKLIQNQLTAILNSLTY